MAHLLQRFDELSTTEDRGGFGALESNFGNLPLKQLVYRSTVLGLAVRTTIFQTYYNPFDQTIEATYIFPIEGQTAVVACEMRVADRVIRAQLKERSEARADYQRSIESGHRAALLEENRPETFSMQVGNIPPGEAIQVCIETVTQLSLIHGEWTLRLPLVVAPRYTSGIALPRSSVGKGTSSDTAQVPDASMVTPPTWLPGFASPVDLRLSVELQMGDLPGAQDWIDSLKSSLHAFVLDSNEAGCRIEILPGERVDRDFILRGGIDDSSIRTTLTADLPSSPTQIVGEAQKVTFALNIVPPHVKNPVPRDIVFLLDRSGSMAGWKMAAAKRGISRLMDCILPDDRFQAIAFADMLDEFTGCSGGENLEAGTKWHSGTDLRRSELDVWLSRIGSRGGTKMEWAIERGLEAYSDGDAEMQTSRNLAIVLVTDGQVTGEDALLRLIGTIPEQRRPRLFCLGIDRAVNGSVLQRLAKLTGGTFELVESEKRLDEVVKRFSEEIGSPVITNLKVEGLSSSALQLAPAKTCTLFSGRALTLYGQVEATSSLALRVCGNLPNGKLWSEDVVATTQPNSRSVFLPLFGKSRVRELEDTLVALGNRDHKLEQQIVACSLECSVLSRLTAFVAVDNSEIVSQGQKPHSIVQPSELPEGWRRNFLTLNALRLSKKHQPEDERGWYCDSFNDSISSDAALHNNDANVGYCSSDVSSSWNDSSESPKSRTWSKMDSSLPRPDSEDLSDAPATRFVSLVIQEAVQLRASHILLAPDGDISTVVYIVEGETFERDSLTKQVDETIVGRIKSLVMKRQDASNQSPPLHVAVVSSLKVLAKLDIGDFENYQSGNVQMMIENNLLELIVHVVGKNLLIEMPAKNSQSKVPAAVEEWYRLYKK